MAASDCWSSCGPQPNDQPPPPAGRAPNLLLLAVLLWAGSYRLGRLPPLGALLHPVRGAWGLAATADLPRRADAALPGLGAAVHVVYDDRAVPHVFAASELDAWRALGYVTARDR